MKRYIALFAAVIATVSAEASWYWPFGSGDETAKEPRLSELMAPATQLIDEASDFAADGKTQDAVDKYRKALIELDRIEAENPERAQKQEFASVRNKRAYVNAAIDTLLLEQVKTNAKPVAVSDTKGLEDRLAEERGLKKPKASEPAAAEKPAVPKQPVVNAKPLDEVNPATAKKPKEEAKPVPDKKADAKPAAKPQAKPQEKKPVADARATESDKAKDVRAIAKGDFVVARAGLAKMLARSPKDPTPLNLKAAMFSAQGKLAEAEATLDEAILANPKSHFAYYNMALLLLKKDPFANRDAARRYYESGRAFGGPKDTELEELLK